MQKLKEAYYYEKTTTGIVCKLCAHDCNLTEGKTGICKTRININGILYSTSYNNPISLNIDPIEKKPLFHFLPGTTTFSIGTEGCNLRCLNCQNYSISQKSSSNSPNEKFSSEKIVKKAIETNCNSISYTYTDPVAFFEYTLDTSKIAKRNNIKNIIVSSGFINEKPLLELIPYIDAANIDLKVFDNEIYRKLTGASLNEVLNTLKTLLQHNVWLEITNLIIPEWSDDLSKIEQMCNWLVNNGFENTPLHFSRFSPMYKLSDLSPTKISTLEKAYEIALKSGLKHIYIGNVWDSERENTFCPKCHNLLLKRSGYNIIFNKIKNSKCPECNTIISGVWN
jgi:pyruvate formate lyase activating enzyme